MSEDRTLCCFECQAINGLWPRIQLARSILQHRSPNTETVALALRALDGEPIERLRGESPAATESKEVN